MAIALRKIKGFGLSKNTVTPENSCQRILNGYSRFYRNLYGAQEKHSIDIR